jgi:enoyl-CoA hydratase/carnithine racemase
MMTELKHALAAAEQDEQVVGIILTGAGRGFCAGMDMNALDAQATGGDLSAGVEVKKLDADPGDKSMGENFQVAFTYIMSIRKPIIVALNGACAGLGMSIALLCDMRFSSENGKFVTAFAQRGLIAEHGQSWILPRLIGSARALDLLWSSRKVAAEEAMQMGLVNRIIPQDELLNETKAYIQNLADNCSPTSLMMMKQQVYRHMNAPLGEAMKESNKWMAESLKRQDFKEGVASYLEKRSPAFDKINM